MYNLRRTCTDRRATICSCEVYMYVLGVCVCVCVIDSSARDFTSR